MCRLVLMGVTLGVLISWAAIVGAATVTIYTDRTEWENALGSQFRTEHFEDEILNAGVSFVSTESGHINTAEECYQDVLASQSQNEPMTIWSFAPGITAYGGDWTLGGPGGSGNSLLVYIDDSSTCVGSISNSYSGEFWGFISDTEFTSVKLVGGGGTNQQNYSLDDMAYSPIPAAGIIIFVDDDAPNDPGPGDPTASDPLEDGTAAHPFDAIQEGIDAATSGFDNVLVRDGTYTGDGNRDIDFNGKAITVASENGADTCIIDCEGTDADPHRGFCFQSGEGPDSVVDGFTITSGYVSGYWPDNCGGGIYFVFSSPTIANCTIRNSFAQYGGGVFCHDNSNPIVTGCRISGNGARSDGGGVSVTEGDPEITGCEITQNTAAFFGGGVQAYYYSSPTITNCLLTGNVAGDSGGAVASTYESSPLITNCTVSGNGAQIGGGIYDNTGDLTITNCILWGDIGALVGHELYISGSGTPTVAYCDIEGGYGSGDNIDLDPLFVHGPEHDYYLSQTASGQTTDSPCVDACNDTADSLGLGNLTTRTDGIGDSGIADMGYHVPYALWIYRIDRSGSDVTIYWNSFHRPATPSNTLTTWSCGTTSPVGVTDNWTDVGGALETCRFYRVLENE